MHKRSLKSLMTLLIHCIFRILLTLSHPFCALRFYRTLYLHIIQIHRILEFKRIKYPWWCSSNCVIDLTDWRCILDLLYKYIDVESFATLLLWVYIPLDKNFAALHEFGLSSLTSPPTGWTCLISANILPVLCPFI